MRLSNNLESKASLDTYWRVQLACMKIQAHNSLEPPVEPLEYNQNKMPLINQGFLSPL